MRKKRTRKPFSRWLRQGIALFVAAAALWLVWLTGDPAATLSRLAGSTQLATALLAAWAYPPRMAQTCLVGTGWCWLNPLY